MTWYKALTEIYSESDIVKWLSAALARGGKVPTASLVRLHKEGFPYETIQAISPKSSNAKRDILLAIARAALASEDYATAALYLNGLNEPDIRRELSKRLKPGAIAALHAAAETHPGLGTGSNIYKFTGE